MCSVAQSSGVAGVEDAVKGGRSPAKRTLEGVGNANMLKGLGLVAAFRGQYPSPSGGKDFTALGGGARGGRARRARRRHPPYRRRFHTKRHKPDFGRSRARLRCRMVGDSNGVRRRQTPRWQLLQPPRLSVDFFYTWAHAHTARIAEKFVCLVKPMYCVTHTLLA